MALMVKIWGDLVVWMFHEYALYKPQLQTLILFIFSINSSKSLHYLNVVAEGDFCDILLII